jgi:hypothetical protein
VIEKGKSVRQKDNSEVIQPHISSFFSGQEGISNTPKNSQLKNAKRNTDYAIVHNRQNEKK